MSEKTKMEVVDGWWNEMGVCQKQMVRLMVQMLGGTGEGEVLEVRRTPGHLKISVVKRPESKEPEVATTKASSNKPSSYRSN
jgi:hypothetical protein